jgi:hypothetical protein
MTIVTGYGTQGPPVRLRQRWRVPGHGGAARLAVHQSGLRPGGPRPRPARCRLERPRPSAPRPAVDAGGARERRDRRPAGLRPAPRVFVRGSGRSVGTRSTRISISPGAPCGAERRPRRRQTRSASSSCGARGCFDANVRIDVGPSRPAGAVDAHHDRARPGLPAGHAAAHRQPRHPGDRFVPATWTGSGSGSRAAFTETALHARGHQVVMRDRGYVGARAATSTCSRRRPGPRSCASV